MSSNVRYIISFIMIHSYMNEIINNLFLGNATSAVYALNKYGLVVNCTKNLPTSKSDPFYDNIEGKFMRLAIDDKPEESNRLSELLPEVLQEIHLALQNNQRVLVHCQQSASRSPSVVAAYLITYHRLSIKEAIEYIKSKHPSAFHGEIFFMDVLQHISDTSKG